MNQSVVLSVPLDTQQITSEIINCTDTHNQTVTRKMPKHKIFT